MEKTKFKVIIGKKAHPFAIKYNFIEAHVTNTRMMGVIGLRIQWETEDGETYHQFFHLDAEEYGLDDYDSVTDGSKEQIETSTLKMMGGLGGEFIPVSEREARYLVNVYAKKNDTFQSPLPDPQWEYAFILKDEVDLSEEEIKILWKKISEEIYSPFQLINYFIMRAVGRDYDALNRLAIKEMDYHPVKKPSTLLKNVIEKIEENGKISYITESLVDTDDSYKMILSEIKIQETEEGLKVSSGEIKSIMNITSTEAAFTLTKKEYIIIYQIENVREGIRLFDELKPHAMKNGYDIGYLYTEFNPNNKHVNQQVYFLNDDIYGVYYITAGEQLVVAAYSRERILELEAYFARNEFEELLTLEEHIDLDQSLLYEFVHSEYENFYDFLDDEE